MKHKIIDYNTFKNSLYIKTIEELFSNTECVNKNGKLLDNIYDFIFNSFNALIKLNNCFKSDSNLSFEDKKNNAIKIIEDYAFKKENGGKYSVRFIKNIVPDKYCVRLYNKIYGYENIDTANISWYYSISMANTKEDIKNVLEEISNELESIDSMGFDNIIKDNTIIKSNNNRLYLSSFSLWCPKHFQNIRAFKKEYNIFLPKSNKEIDNVIELFILVAKAYNGIFYLLNPKSIEYEMSKDLKDLIHRSSKESYIEKVNELLKLGIKTNEKYDEMSSMLNACDHHSFNDIPNEYDIYLDYLNLPSDKITRTNQNDFYKNLYLLKRTLNIEYDRIMENYDLYYFIVSMKCYIGNVPKSDIAKNVYYNLKQVYKILVKESYTEKELLICKETLLKIIERFSNYYIRIS